MNASQIDVLTEELAHTMENHIIAYVQSNTMELHANVSSLSSNLNWRFEDDVSAIEQFAEGTWLSQFIYPSLGEMQNS